MISDEDLRQMNLWRQVLIQALIDATSPYLTREDQEEAIAWIRASIGLTSEDFEDVCHLAKVDPFTFRKNAEELLNKGERYKLRSE